MVQRDEGLRILTKDDLMTSNIKILICFVTGLNEIEL